MRIKSSGPCLYCGGTPPGATFAGREHVIPQSFGTFEPQNLLLYDVCDACNKSMGDELDIVFAKGSFEGLLRFETGLKLAVEYKSIGKRSRYRSVALEGPLKAMYVAPVVSADRQSLVYQPVPQLGFALTEEGPYDYYRGHEIPTRDALRVRYGQTNLCVKAVGFPPETDIRAFLIECGFEADPAPLRADFAIVTAGTSSTPIDYRFRVDRTLFRAIAKVAFGYLAVSHPEIARMPTFAAIRAFIRYGTEPGFRVVGFRPTPIRTGPVGPPPTGHILAVRFREDVNEVVGYVTLFNRVHYEVCLATEAFLTTVSSRVLARAHFFDTKTRTMRQLPT